MAVCMSAHTCASCHCSSARVHICACGINKRRNERGQFSVAVVMRQWSVARHDDRDGAELFYCIVLETQTSDRDVSELRRAETDGRTDIKKKKREIHDAKDRYKRQVDRGSAEHLCMSRTVCICVRV